MQHIITPTPFKTFLITLHLKKWCDCVEGGGCYEDSDLLREQTMKR